MNLSQLEREFFGQVGANPDEPLSSIKRRYLLSQVEGTQNEGIELEKRWLRKLIADNGGTPQGIYLSDLYKQAAGAVGGNPTNNVTNNKREVYTNA